MVRQPDRPSYAVLAPEFPEGLEWLNTGRPLRLRDLRGRFVLLDFWTYCCINCMHILPDLAWLERKYAGEPFTVIGVHSAKFTNEQQAGNIREAIRRYEIAHPVVNDSAMAIWQGYGIRSWPTLLLIDPEGYVVWAASGEGHREELDERIGEGLAAWRAAGGLATEPLALEREPAPASPLAYPAKLAADARADRLYISDSSHNRVVVTDLAGRFVESIGSGLAGFRDGDAATARFSRPQGVLLDRGALYVADTENHAVRRVDLAARHVTTIVGTGEQSADYARGSGQGRAVAIASPWDLAAVGDMLYIAMAGSHQIWRYDLARDWVEPYAGTGREARIDGPRGRAAFAQPSGLTTDGERLYVADSEVSAIRAVDLVSGAVATLAGGDLFDFGDIDGPGARARLQHPLGVLCSEGTLYIADTYNHKVKALDLASGTVRTVAGGGTADALYEPSGFALAGSTLYVADTNHHAVRRMELPDGALSPFDLTDVPIPPPAPGPGRIVQLAEVTLAPGAGSVALKLDLPPGHHLNPGSPSGWEATVRGTGLTLDRLEGGLDAPELRVGCTRDGEGDGTLTIAVDLYHCGDDGLCRYERVSCEIPYRIARGGAVDGALGVARASRP